MMPRVSTVIVVCRVAALAPHRAVNVYVVVLVGDTLIKPGVAIPPIPWSISTESAFVTAPQLNVADCPRMMEDEDELKYAILGIPLQPRTGGGAVGVGVRVRVGVIVIGETVIVNKRSAV